jgi:hypothetical protein
MILTLLSAIFGGALRLAPEVLKFLGQNEQNAHELAMQDKQLQFLQVQGQLKTDEINAQGAINMQQAQIQAITALNQSQASEAMAGGWFVAAINALVRPMVTFYIFGLWGAYTLACLLNAYQQSGNAIAALMGVWTQDDASMLSMIASFYFVGRVWDKQS